jgi:hypothetical protein
MELTHASKTASSTPPSCSNGWVFTYDTRSSSAFDLVVASFFSKFFRDTTTLASDTPEKSGGSDKYERPLEAALEKPPNVVRAGLLPNAAPVPGLDFFCRLLMVYKPDKNVLKNGRRATCFSAQPRGHDVVAAKVLGILCSSNGRLVTPACCASSIQPTVVAGF